MSKKAVIIISITVVLALLAGGVYLLLQNNNDFISEDELSKLIRNGEINTQDYSNLVNTGRISSETAVKTLKKLAGVHSIEVKENSFGAAEIQVECYAISEYRVSMIDSLEPIYLGDNKQRYFDELGKYYCLIKVSDASLSEAFSDEYECEKIYEFSNATDYRFLIVASEDHSTEIYIGSDKKFSVDEQNSSTEESLKKTIVVPLK